MGGLRKYMLHNKTFLYILFLLSYTKHFIKIVIVLLNIINFSTFWKFVNDVVELCPGLVLCPLGHVVDHNHVGKVDSELGQQGRHTEIKG